MQRSVVRQDVHDEFAADDGAPCTAACVQPQPTPRTRFVLVLGIRCWAPYTILGVIVTFWDTEYYQFVKRCTLVPGFFNSSLNWVIYGYRNREFKITFQKLYRTVCKRGSNENRSGPHTRTNTLNSQI